MFSVSYSLMHNIQAGSSLKRKEMGTQSFLTSGLEGIKHVSCFKENCNCSPLGSLLLNVPDAFLSPVLLSLRIQASVRFFLSVN